VNDRTNSGGFPQTKTPDRAFEDAHTGVSGDRHHRSWLGMRISKSLHRIYGSWCLVASKTVVSAPQLQSPLNNPRFRICGHYDKAVVC
jgi:hypothetical protein